MARSIDREEFVAAGQHADERGQRFGGGGALAGGGRPGPVGREELRAFVALRAVGIAAEHRPVDGDDLPGLVRDVRQGPDGLIYVLTEEDDGAVLRIEPAP